MADHTNLDLERIQNDIIECVFLGSEETYWRAIDLAAEKVDQLGFDAYMDWARGIAAQFVGPEEAHGWGAVVFGLRALVREDAGLPVTE